jgi:serine/threonine-protein kinase RsbT
MVARARTTEQVLTIIGRHLSGVTARAVLDISLRRQRLTEATLDQSGLTQPLLTELRCGLGAFFASATARHDCVQQLESLLPRRATLVPSLTPSASAGPITIQILDDTSVVEARFHARLVATQVGFDPTDQTRIATAVSELARNIQRYAGTGTVELAPLRTPRPGIRVVARDHGPGITHLDEILAGEYASKTGLGLGIRGCRQLMDEFTVQTSPEGTVITLHKYLA